MDYAPVQRWLYWPDETSLDIIYACAGHFLFSGDPLWLLAVGPPGCGKTELIRSLKDHWATTSLDVWSPKALSSGFKTIKDGKDTDDYSLLRKLNRKLLLIKDLTGILGSASSNGKELIDQLRGVYDGYWDKATGLGQKSYNAKFGLIAGCTPAIDSLRLINAAMGDRFLRVEWPTNTWEITKKSETTSGQKETMRKEMTVFSEGILEDFSSTWEQYDNLELPSTAMTVISLYATGVASLKAAVIRDHQHIVQDMPISDAGGRITTNLTELCKALMCLKKEVRPTKGTIAALRRVAWCIIPKMRRRILEAMAQDDWTTSEKISEALSIPEPTIREQLEDLWVTGLMERRKEGRSARQYRFASFLVEWFQTLKFSEEFGV